MCNRAFDKIICGNCHHVIVPCCGLRKDFIYLHFKSSAESREIPQGISKFLFYRMAILRICFAFPMELFCGCHNTADFTKQAEKHGLNISGWEPICRLNLLQIIGEKD